MPVPADRAKRTVFRVLDMPDEAAPEAGASSGGVPESGVPEAVIPEAVIPQRGDPESGASADAAAPEAGAPSPGSAAGSGRAAGERTVVAKIGTSSITDEIGAIDRAALEKFCGEVAELRRSGSRVLVVTSGAIAAGLPELNLGGERRPSSIKTLQAVATVGQSALMGIYREIFARLGVVAGQVLLVPLDFVIRSQYVHAAETLRRLLDLGVVPIVNENDAVADDEIRWGDNDRIAALVANLVQADLLVLLTDTAGVLSDDPRRNSDASLISEIVEFDQMLASRVGGAGTRRGSGGMASKLTAARVASLSGVPTVIADARRPDVLADAAAGLAGVGTLVRASAQRLPARKLWIGFAVVSQGVIVVDSGARAALERGKSLLAIGVTSVGGDFDAGSPVEVQDQHGAVFAKGLARHSGEELRSAVGRRREDLPPGAPNVVIHANDLVVLPAA
ncbi:MAG: glutamate 5-kinase [Acidimicrobiaceae bacterium]|nr:glutamate 5-kinase [Acidimicrobiaceae bacterium]MCY4280507.1 glutamate 5-kinase [Acidimicrobiaceae bacterium]MCY4293733.1 glutamate 5-kinase [Acidimicrobiaceae bacterium]